MKSKQARLVFPRREGCSALGSCRAAWGLTWTLMIIALSGCRSEMYDQPRYEPLEHSEFFETAIRHGRWSPEPFLGLILAGCPGCVMSRCS